MCFFLDQDLSTNDSSSEPIGSGSDLASQTTASCVIEESAAISTANSTKGRRWKFPAYMHTTTHCDLITCV